MSKWSRDTKYSPLQLVWKLRLLNNVTGTVAGDDQVSAVFALLQHWDLIVGAPSEFDLNKSLLPLAAPLKLLLSRAWFTRR
jgi:hypothetical protein